MGLIQKLLNRHQKNSIDISKVSYVSIDEFILSLSRRIADVEQRLHAVELVNKDLVDKVLRKIQKRHEPQTLKMGSPYHKV